MSPENQRRPNPANGEAARRQEIVRTLEPGDSPTSVARWHFWRFSIVTDLTKTQQALLRAIVDAGPCHYEPDGAPGCLICSGLSPADMLRAIHERAHALWRVYPHDMRALHDIVAAHAAAQAAAQARGDDE